MMERLVVYDRCLAIQLAKESGKSGWEDNRFLPTEEGSDGRKSSCTTSSGTPTPTNPPSERLGYDKSPAEPFDSYQSGFLLFQSWVSANAVCVWDSELVASVTASVYVGAVTGGFLLIGGAPRTLAVIRHAHARCLLNPPPGHVILLLGEINGCVLTPVTRGHFTPLGEALCWVVHNLRSKGFVADQASIRTALINNFPSMTPPDSSLIHSALSDLIRQRKVYHTGKEYNIVQNDTYTPVKVSLSVIENPARLMSTSEALTKVHGVTESEADGLVTHAAVQTDLADLLAGSWADAAILAPSTRATMVDSLSNLHRRSSLRSLNHRLPSRSGSLRASPTKSASSSTIPHYIGDNMSDITVKDWAPRSSTLPRRPSRPLSTTPPRPSTSDSLTTTTTLICQQCSTSSNTTSSCSQSTTPSPHSTPVRRPLSTTPSVVTLSQRSRIPSGDSSDTRKSRPLSRNFSYREAQDNRKIFIPTCSPPRNAVFNAEVSGRVQSLSPKRTKIVPEKRNQSEGRKDSEIKLDRTALRLELKDSNMNNSRKIVSSPQRPEGLKNNDLRKEITDITKHSCSDLTTVKNLCYRNVDKCDKKLYMTDKLSPNSDICILQENFTNEIKNEASCDKNNSEKHNNRNSEDIDLNKTQNQDISDVVNDDFSVKTYPSLSDLNLQFNSITAQKILRGVSINSIDTLIEVNMAAEKRKMPKLSEPITNTDFGFV